MIFSASKKVHACLLIVSVLFSLLCMSCKKRTTSNDHEVTFDTIQTSKTQSIDYNDSKLNCKLQIVFTYPVSCSNLALLSNLQKIFIEKVFPPRYANLSPQEAMENFSAQYIRSFQSINFENFIDEEYVQENENEFIYELRLENEILFNRKNFISFVVKNNNYEGGAHGSNSIYGYVINLNTGEIVTEENFAGDNYKKNLSSVIAHKIASSKGLSDVYQLESMGYNAVEDIVPNDNFTIDNDGITYYFNEYEIAAYFVGITKVFIPYEELKSYIINNSLFYSLTGF